MKMKGQNKLRHKNVNRFDFKDMWTQPHYNLNTYGVT